MTNKNVEQVMDEVISTTSAARNLLFKDGVVQEHTEDDLSVVKQVIAANKNLVSASIVLLTIHKREEKFVKHAEEE